MAKRKSSSGRKKLADVPQSMVTPILNQVENNQDSSEFGTGTGLQLKPVGSSGTELFAGYFTEEYLQQLRGRLGAKVYDEIRRSETQVSMLLNAVMNPIKAGVWEFEAAADVPNGEFHKEFIEYCAKEAIDWETHLHEALTMLIYGYSVFEIVHSVILNHAKFGNMNGIKGLAFRNPKTIERWNLDRATGNLLSVEQWVHGDLAPDRMSLTKMLAQFLLVFTLQKEGDNYEGISMLRPMYGPWFRKNLYLKIAGIGMERNAVGTVVGTIPKGKNKDEEVNNFKSILQNFVTHETAFIMKPEGWEVEILKHEFKASEVKEMLLFENTEMINSVVANFLALGMNGGSGSFALGTDLSDFFLTGIQNYANIICGVWNRKLIPDLIKLNFGPQAAYPKLKATGINDKAGKELAEVIGIMVEKKAITADMPLEDFLRKQFSLPKADPTTARQQEEPKPFMFSERHIKLAESYKKQFDNNKNDVKDVMQSGMADLLEGLKKQVKSKFNGGTPASRASLALELEPKGVPAYKDSLREALAKVANDALLGAKKETPKAKKIKLAETFQLAAPKGGYFNALSPKVKRLVKAQADLIAETQAADLGKIVAFQYSSSQASTEDIDLILKDIDEAARPSIEGATKKGISVDAAAANAVASVANQARMEWFFEPEVLETIESFTFVNEDPVSAVCQELDGTTLLANDPDLDRYATPLHHNCKSRWVPNEKGAKGNPEIKRGGVPISQKALDSITLCECSYHLESIKG